MRTETDVRENLDRNGELGLDIAVRLRPHNTLYRLLRVHTEGAQDWSWEETAGHVAPTRPGRRQQTATLLLHTDGAQDWSWEETAGHGAPTGDGRRPRFSCTRRGHKTGAGRRRQATALLLHTVTGARCPACVVVIGCNFENSYDTVCISMHTT